MIDIKYFDLNLLSIKETSFINTDAVTYHIKYIAMESLDHVNIDCRNRWIHSTDKNKEILEKQTKI